MIEVRTPCRLHFGLLAYNPDEPRQFGGAGLMVRRPDIILRAEPADTFTATGPMSDRAVEFAKRFAQASQLPLRGASIRVVRAPRPHTGMGTGTQLAMAVARALAAMNDRDDLNVSELAQHVGRGERSAIGAHGFFHGGMIIDGGKRSPGDLSPMLIRHSFPAAWRLLLITPHALEGTSGERERQVFRTALTIPREITAEMCRLVLLGLTPAVIEHDLEVFGESLYQLQQIVGRCFAPAQGGIYASPLLQQMVDFIRGRGVRGVGQSSWGPTLYAVTADLPSAEALAGEVQSRFDLAPGELLITEADNEGATIRRMQNRITTESHHHHENQ